MTRSPVLILSSLLFFSPALASDLPESFQSKFESRLHFIGAAEQLIRPAQRDEPASTKMTNGAEPRARVGISSRLLSGATRARERPDLTMQIESQGEKSAALAALYSLLLPGMGELYTDGFGSGKYFMIAEGALWLTFAVFETYGNALRDDSRVYAISRAGIDPVGKDDQYYVDVGNFLDIDEYNEKQLRDREPENLYDPAAGYAWQWDSDASRAAYREQRIDSETMFNNKKFVVAAVLINHVASAINAARSAISFNDALKSVLGDLRVSAGVMGGVRNPHGLVVTLSKGF